MITQDMLKKILAEEVEVIIPSGNIKDQEEVDQDDRTDDADAEKVADNVADETSGSDNLYGDETQDDEQKKRALELSEEDIEVDLNDDMEDGESDPMQDNDSNDIKLKEAMYHDRDELAHMDDEELKNIAEDEGLGDKIEYNYDGKITNRDEIIDTLMHIDEALDFDAEEDDLNDDEDEEGADLEDMKEEAIPIKRAEGRSADDENRVIRANGKYDAADNGRAQADRAKFDAISKQEAGDGAEEDAGAKAENDRIKMNYKDNQRKAGEKVPAFDVKVNEKYMTALFGGDKTLTEGFKKNAAVVFEAAVKDAARQRSKQLEEHYSKKFSRQLRESVDSLVDKLDGYLGVIAESWMKENEIAIESSIRNKISDNLLQSIKEAFDRNYIEVPESKIDLVKALKGKNKKLENALNESTKDVVALKAKVQKMQQKEVLMKESQGLSAMQAKKLEELAENVKADTQEEFTRKVKIFKESFFKQGKVNSTSAAPMDKGVKEEMLSEDVAAFVKAIERTIV